MMNHANEYIIEKYFLNPEILTQSEKNALLGHIEVCSLCAEEFERIGKFYNMLDREIQIRPTHRDREFAGRAAIRRRLFLQGRRKELENKDDRIAEAFAEIVEPYRQSLPQRVIDYFRYHPIRSAGTAMGMAAVLFGALFFFNLVKDSKLDYVRAKDEFLVAYDKNGGELWRKHIGVGYDWNDLKHVYGDLIYCPEDIANAIDIDGDGTKEVVSLFAVKGLRRESNAIICFNSDGLQRWRFEFHRNMVFGKESFTDDYSIRTFKVKEFRHDKNMEIAAVANHRSHYPGAIVLIDANTGELISEYWHSGFFGKILTMDMDHNGIEHIVVTAENNGFNLSSVTVLDPRMMSGHAPAPPEYTPQGVPEGTEKFYMTIPRSDAQRLSTYERNVIDKCYLNQAGLELVVSEIVGDARYSLFFHFDSAFNCIKVENSGEFVVFHRKMEAEGKLTQKLDKTYYENLRENVQYWDGEKFVKTPSQNKNYKIGVAG